MISKNNRVFCYRDARYLSSDLWAMAYLCPLLLYEEYLDNRLCSSGSSSSRFDYGRFWMANVWGVYPSPIKRLCLSHPLSRSGFFMRPPSTVKAWFPDSTTSNRALMHFQQLCETNAAPKSIRHPQYQSHSKPHVLTVLSTFSHPRPHFLLVPNPNGRLRG